MPNWNAVLDEIDRTKVSNAWDTVRRRYLRSLAKQTGRNVIAYYSGWLSRPGQWQANLDDSDKNGFMTTIHKLDRSKGLDLILHTPGGSIAATESIVDYLHRMFGSDIRAIVPQLAMSAGTMIACACKEIIMGAQSNLGPIDPQFGGISSHGVLEEFESAKQAIKADPSTIPLWQAIIGKYRAAFIGDCQKAMVWSCELVSQWLEKNMFAGEPDSKKKAMHVVSVLSDHGEHKAHDRHINIDDCRDTLGLKVIELEAMDGMMQDRVLSVHHSFMHTFSRTPAIKIIENHNGIALVRMLTP